MALLEIALVGGAAYAAMQNWRQRGQKRSLVDVIKTKTAETTSSTQFLLAKLDARYQTFIQTKLDPLLGGAARHQQMEKLASETKLQVQYLRQRSSEGLKLLRMN